MNVTKLGSMGEGERYNLTDPSVSTTDGPKPRVGFLGCDMTVPLSVRGEPVCAMPHHACRHAVRVVDGRREMATSDAGLVVWRLL